MYVCKSVRNGFTIEIYGFGLRTLLARAAHGASASAMDDSEDRRQWQARERVQRYRRRLTAQQRDERRQDNSDRRRLARQYLSDSLCSLTR